MHVFSDQYPTYAGNVPPISSAWQPAAIHVWHRGGIGGTSVAQRCAIHRCSLSSNYADIFRVRFSCVTLNFKISKLHDFFGTMFFCSWIISGFCCTIHTSPQLPLGSLELPDLLGLVRPVTGSPAVRSFLDDASSSIFIVIILRQSRRPVLGWRLCGCYRHQNQQQQQQQQENISNHSPAPLH